MKKFRSDINGLRAWAVLAVILYHFGVKGFSGGFVGVDIFFVISGFLMTGIVVGGLEKSSFSVLEFYMARARRIMPALVVLCLVLLAVGWWTLLPPDYKRLAGHVVLSIGFLSNFKFWSEAGYFDVSSHEKLLLHTWSLAVEWQFYLILPLALLAVWKFRPARKSVILVLLAGLLVSLVLSIVVTPLEPTAAFYLLPTRAWEMLAGGLVYMLAHREALSARSRTLIEFAGFVLVVGSIVGFDSSSAWPGWRALVPVIGTVLVLFAARSGSIFTGLNVAQWVGTRSYSLYLWHWPIVAALTYYELQANLILIAVGLGLTLVFGHLSYHLVEAPARIHLNKKNFLMSGVTLFSGAALVTAIGFAIYFSLGVSGRFSPEIEAVVNESSNTNPNAYKCLLTSGVESPSCMFGGETLQAIVLGDSHASATVSAVVEAAADTNGGVMEWSYIACPIIQGVHSQESKQCGDFVNWAVERLDDIPKSVPLIIVNRHAQYVFGKNEDSSGKSAPQVYFSRVYEDAESSYLKEYAQNLESSACKLAKDRTVYLVRPIPEMGFNVPLVMARTMIIGKQEKAHVTLAEYRHRQDFIWDAQDAARDHCGIKILDPLPYLCSDGVCHGEKNNRPLYRDDDHLSEFGNKLLTPMFAEVFRDLKGAHSKNMDNSASLDERKIEVD